MLIKNTNMTVNINCPGTANGWAMLNKMPWNPASVAGIARWRCLLFLRAMLNEMACNSKEHVKLYSKHIHRKCKNIANSIVHIFTNTR